MLRALLSVLLLLPGLEASAQSLAETYTLEDSLRLAMRNNAELQSAEQDITIARQRAKEATLLFYPEVGLQALATRYQARYPFALKPSFGSLLLFPSQGEKFYSGQAYMTLSLYEGRRQINTLRLAQTALKQAQSKYDAVKMDILYNTKRVFYRLILAQQNLAAVEEVTPNLKPAESAAKSASFERIESEALKDELRAQESDARHEVGLARLEFLKGLNRELDTPAAVEGQLETRAVDVDLKQALVWATELRPELQSQTYKAQMDAIAVNLTLGRRNPSLILGLDYDLDDQRFPLKQNNWDATVGLKIPFAFDYWTQHTQKVAEQRQGEISRAELHDQVHLEVRKAHKDFIYWQEEYPTREKEYERLKNIYDGAVRSSPRSPAKWGAAMRLLQAHRRYLEAVTEHILARARLERAIGRALPER